MSRTYPRVKSGAPLVPASVESVGHSKQVSAEVNRRACTSAAVLGLAISMGASSLLVPQQNDGAIASEPIVAEPSLADTSAGSLNPTVESPDTQFPTPEISSVTLAATDTQAPTKARSEALYEAWQVPNLLDAAQDKSNLSGDLSIYVAQADASSGSKMSAKLQPFSVKSTVERSVEGSSAITDAQSGASVSAQDSQQLPLTPLVQGSRSSESPAVATVPMRSVQSSAKEAVIRNLVLPASEGSAGGVFLLPSPPSEPILVSALQPGLGSTGSNSASGLVPTSSAVSRHNPYLDNLKVDVNQLREQVVLSSTATNPQSSSVVAESSAAEPSVSVSVARSNDVPVVASAVQDVQQVQPSPEQSTNLQPSPMHQVSALTSVVVGQRVQVLPQSAPTQQVSSPDPQAEGTSLGVAPSQEPVVASAPSLIPEAAKASNYSAADVTVQNQAETLQAEVRSTSIIPSAVPVVPTRPQQVSQATTPEPSLYAAAPAGSNTYAPITQPLVGQTVSPDLPPLGNADRYLPGGQSFDGYVWPARGVLTSGYGWRWGRMHRGIDIAGPIGTPITAAAPGVVVTAGWNSGGYGNLVEIQHPDGSLTLYAHNNRILVQVGQQVSQGQQIAEMGSTGYSTGPHLHFEIHPRGQGAINPLAMLPSP